jgi:putative membrane protein
MSDRKPNEGSRARDHLANERTFLAWVRTALGGIALGVAVERFSVGADDRSNIALAALLVGFSVAILVGATVRYYGVMRDLEEGQFEVDRRSPVVVLAGVVVIAVLAVILAF